MDERVDFIYRKFFDRAELIDSYDKKISKNDFR